MRPATLITCLWPGLGRLWWRGETTALLPAVAFGVTLNVLLLATFIWPELAPTTLVRWGWIVLALFWGVGLWHGFSILPQLTDGANGADRALFLQAQEEYLRGHWFEAEILLERILKTDTRDVETRLMLATMYRRTHRCEEAHEELSRLELLERADLWRLEIEGERRALDELRQETQQADGEIDASASDSEDATATDPTQAKAA